VGGRPLEVVTVIKEARAEYDRKTAIIAEWMEARIAELRSGDVCESYARDKYMVSIFGDSALELISDT